MHSFYNHPPIDLTPGPRPPISKIWPCSTAGYYTLNCTHIEMKLKQNSFKQL